MFVTSNTVFIFEYYLSIFFTPCFDLIYTAKGRHIAATHVINFTIKQIR